MRPCHLERSNINCRACYSTLKCRPLHTNYDSIVTSTSYMPNIPSGNIPHYRHNGILLLYYCIAVHSGFLASSSIPLNSIIFTFFKIAQAPGYAVNDVTGRHCKTFFQAYRSCFRTMIVISLRSLSESQWSYGDFRPPERRQYARRPIADSRA